MNNIDKHGVAARTSQIVRKACGRCGTAIEESEFCLECQEFFHRLSGQTVVFATVVRTTRRHWSGVSGK